MGCFCFKGLFVNQPKRPTRRKNGAARIVLLRALERFEEKPESEQEDILIYLSMNWKDLQQDSSIIEALKETRFVTSTDGGLYKPKDLFDPGDALLTSLFSDKFPGERFVSNGWISILRNTGLRTTRDADTVLQCARRIEFLGAESMTKHVGANQVSLEIWSLAETLIDTVLENSALLHDHSFCSVLAKIACVPAEKGFPFRTGKRGVTRVVCSYSDAILLDDWPLAWTVAPILSKAPPDYSWGALQLRSPPPFTTVLNHLQAETWCIGSRLYTIETVSFEVLKYLDKIWETLSSSGNF
ncbi:hypothetical protein Hanom_Chr08g00701961 [Helianthus anomalus]